MMAVDDKKRVLLVRQYRLPAEKYLWELPAGTVDPRREAAAGRQARAEGGDRLQGAEVDASWRRFSRQPRLRAGAHDDLPRRGSDRRARPRRWTMSRSRRAGSSARNSPQMIAEGKIEDGKDDDRLPHVASRK